MIAAGFVVLGFAVVSAGTVANAATTDGSVTVVVARDFSGDGLYRTTDPDVAGITITMTDGANTLTGTTDATGTVTFAPSATLADPAPYRVQVQPLPSSLSYLQAAPAANNTNPNHFSSFTSFVNPSSGTNITLHIGLWDPADYIQTDARVVVPVDSSWAANNSGLGTSTTALLSEPNAVANSPVLLANQVAIGNTFGAAYDRTTNRVFTAAFAKVYAPYGPGGAGAIYVTQLDATGHPTSTAQLATVANVGPGGSNTPTAHNTNVSADSAFFSVPGTESLGGMAISDDNSTLYVVNLGAKTLVSFPISNPSAQTSVAIPDPGCSGGAWRPMGVAVHNGTPYVGGTCDASTSGSRDDLQAVLYSYNGSTFSTVLSHGLSDLRGHASNSDSATNRNDDIDTHWNSWISTYADSSFNRSSGTLVTRPQPELASFAFDSDGSIVLGFRDRTGDQTGNNAFTSTGVQRTGSTGGDLLRACSNGSGGFVWDGSTGCPSHNNGLAGAASNSCAEPATVLEFYPTECSPAITPQQEAAQGSVVVSPQLGQITSTYLDPDSVTFSDGLGFFSTDGSVGPGLSAADATSRSLEVVPASNGFGKANGLGAIAVLADNAPVQIGNRVWYDTDKNGIQNAGEPSLPGVTVKLHDGGSTGPVVATTTTDGNGEYYFGGAGAAYQLITGHDYTVEFDVSTADTSVLPSPFNGVPASELVFTAALQGSPVLDSNVTPPTTGTLTDGFAAVTAPATPGTVNHTIDAGVVLPQQTPPSTPVTTVTATETTTATTTTTATVTNTVPTTITATVPTTTTETVTATVPTTSTATVTQTVPTTVTATVPTTVTNTVTNTATTTATTTATATVTQTVTPTTSTSSGTTTGGGGGPTTSSGGGGTTGGGGAGGGTTGGGGAGGGAGGAGASGGNGAEGVATGGANGAEGIAINTGGPKTPHGPDAALILLGTALIATGTALGYLAVRRRPKHS